MHILSNISKGKSNQTIKLGQLIEYNTGNIFVEKSYTECGGETIPGPFSKNQNWVYLWINSLKLYTVSLYCMLVWGQSKYIETKLQTICLYLI